MADVMPAPQSQLQPNLNFQRAAAPFPFRQRWPRALFYAVTLSAWFMLIYNSCNYYTSLRNDVGTLYFAWELSIPLIPWMVVPYMLLDAFFFFAPFVTQTKREMRYFALRYLVMQVLAGLVFLAVPLQLAFHREEVPGIFGPVFQFLYGFDQIYNLLPCLHVTIGMLVWRVYWRHTQGWVRWAIHVWFLLIIFSTLFTHQHHVADLVAGFWLAVLMFYLFPDSVWEERTAEPLADSRSFKAGLRCFLGALVFAVAGWWLGGWWLCLFYPAASLLIVTAGYWGLGGQIYRKAGGEVHWSAKALLGPYLIGLWLSREYYWRQAPAFSQVGERVVLGRLPDAGMLQELQRAGVTGVLDLTAEHSEPLAGFSGAYRNLPILDLAVPTGAHLAQGRTLLEELAAGGGKVYIHCGLGYSRSAALAVVELLRIGAAKSVEEAVAQVQAARPQVKLKPAWIHALNEFAAKPAA